MEQGARRHRSRQQARGGALATETVVRLEMASVRMDIDLQRTRWRLQMTCRPRGIAAAHERHHVRNLLSLRGKSGILRTPTHILQLK